MISHKLISISANLEIFSEQNICRLIFFLLKFKQAAKHANTCEPNNYYQWSINN